MRSLLKLVVFLFCVQTADSHWLRSLLDQRGETASPSSPDEEAAEDHKEGSGAGSVSGPGVPVPVLIRSRRSSPDSHCGLRSVLLQVRDLGLGYDSDETVLFKYCSGTCPRVRSNHDLTLTNLLVNGVLPHPPLGELWHNAPCCRPTHHEDLAFLDNSYRWHKVEKLLAAGCSCVG
ncbi:persephin [Myripristis murdjan]|uniref:persephin n=1 Tax=Myripristis murdjan TaxID=586833 RepID=UPI001175F6F8|nr:persephin-like [Myripristis murdjan]